MASSWRKLCDWIHRGTYTNPENFDMYIHNDFYGYGLLELLENLLVEFDRAFAKKNKNVQELWCLTATMANWLNHPETNIWLMIDDSERTEWTFGLLGCMLLTTLHVVDREGELHADSKFRDLGLVMALFLKSAIEPAQIPLETGLEWRDNVVGYAKLANIDLVQVGAEGLAENLEEFAEVPALQSSKQQNDRWEWKKQIKAYKKGGYRIGGESHNIVAMSRLRRAKYAFEHEDPLKEWSLKDLREGNLMVAWVDDTSDGS